MKITKYEHACLDITEKNTRVIIDPGEFSTSLTDFSAVNAVVITHIHGDHFNPETLKNIISQNPAVRIFTTSQVVSEFPDHTEKAIINQPAQVGDMTLEFFGEDHAEIDPQTPVDQNVGVLVNQKLYYPGDSFMECDKAFNALAVPASAPWLRVGQTIPLIKNSQCKQVFPTHNALLSEIGQQTTNAWLKKFSERSGKSFTYLKPGEFITI